MRMPYIASRAALAAVLAVALYFGGLPWWSAAIAWVATLTFFVWAPGSGRYVVREKGGATPLRRDERAQAVADKAARNAFVATILAVAALTMVYGRVLEGSVPVSALVGVLGLAALTYALSDLCLRRSS
jgi:1,4-dihydroxy-2-naphthoate octaprenyltransferase